MSMSGGSNAGGHAMKLTGWGCETNGDLYWEFQNQWATSWGDNGYVFIKAGEVGIDNLVLTCEADA